MMHFLGHFLMLEGGGEPRGVSAKRSPQLNVVTFLRLEHSGVGPHRHY